MDIRELKDTVASSVMWVFSVFVLSLVFFMVGGLFFKAKPIFAIQNIGQLIFTSVWHPSGGKFGMGGFILGSFWVTAIAMIIAIPLSLLTAIYISEYAHRKVRRLAKSGIDLLAGISPVIYGVWGVIVIVPFVRDQLMPFFSRKMPFFPFASDNYTGFSALAGGIVLAVMSFPVMIMIEMEVIASVPLEMREASLALGATKWQTIKCVVLQKAWPGIIAAVILGLSRAFGETMAVLMVAGCALGVFTRSVFDPAYPLPALIANTYGEMMSIPLYDSAILLAALALLIVTICFTAAGRGLLYCVENRSM